MGRENEGHLGEDDDRGVVLLLTALGIITLLVIAALVIDIGYAKQFRRQSQATADASALAAAQYLSTKPDPRSDDYTRAAEIARDLSISNEPELGVSLWSSCDGGDRGTFRVLPDEEAGTGSCVAFDPDNAEGRLVRVVLPRVRTPRFFGGVVGHDGLNVNAMAQARWTTGGGGSGPCGLCIIDGGTLQFSNNVTVRVDSPGSIYGANLTVNATDSSTFQPTPLRYSGANNSNWRRNQPDFDSLYTKGQAFEDPYTVTMDFTGVTTDQSNINNCSDFKAKVRPNVMFTQSVTASDCSHSLSSGTYYFAGTVNLTRSTISGHNVTLVFGCANGSRTQPANCSGEGGNFNFDGGSINIVAPQTGPYAGFGILYDPDNRAGTPSKVTNNGTLHVEGNVYAKRAGITLSNGSVNAWSIVVGARAFDINGGTMHITSQSGGGGGGGSGEISLYR